MRTRDVVGKRIARVEQGVRDTRQNGGRCNVVDAIVLEDGTRLVPVTIETDFGDYFHEFDVDKTRKGK